MSIFLHEDNNNNAKAIIAVHALRILSKNSQAENALKNDW